MSSRRGRVIWAALAIAIVAPIALAAASPQLAWRDPVYIVAGFAGIVALALVFLQPLLAAAGLPDLPMRAGRNLHRWVGSALVGAIALHVAGLWLTSPPDALDALLFRSPTPFSPWGVVAMWALFGTALLAALRGWLRLRPKVWRIAHTLLAMIIVVGSVIHALLVEGAMEPISKAIFCALVLAAMLRALVALRSWTLLRPGGPRPAGVKSGDQQAKRP